MERVTARGIIVLKNQLAVVRRINEGREYLTLPGGGVENGESLEETLKREVWEETGLHVVGSLWVYANDWKGVRHNYYQCQVKEAELHKLVLKAGPELKPLPGQSFEPMWISLKDEDLMKMLRPIEIREYLVE